jgi:hypothetical protein
VARKSKPRLPDLDLRPYAGRWVALVGGRVAGVGLTAEEARRAAQLSRPKEEPEVRFVPAPRPNVSQKELF